MPNRFHCSSIKTIDCNVQNTNTEDDRGICVHHRQAWLKNPSFSGNDLLQTKTYRANTAVLRAKISTEAYGLEE